jgi:hypothetical protein
MSKQVGDWFLTGTLIEGSCGENTANSKNLLERVQAKAPAASACVLTRKDNRRHGCASIALDAAPDFALLFCEPHMRRSILRAAENRSTAISLPMVVRDLGRTVIHVIPAIPARPVHLQVRSSRADRFASPQSRRMSAIFVASFEGARSIFASCLLMCRNSIRRSWP